MAKACRLFWSDCSWSFLHMEPSSDPQYCHCLTRHSTHILWLIFFSMLAILLWCSILYLNNLPSYASGAMHESKDLWHLYCSSLETWSGRTKEFWGLFLTAKAYGLKCFDSQSWSKNQEYSEKHSLPFTKGSFYTVNRSNESFKNTIDESDNNSIQIKLISILKLHHYWLIQWVDALRIF